MSATQKPDHLIVGAGILGLTLARELKRREPSSSIVILEKEDSIGVHSSGRNSGVLHSGIYYPSGSLKAKLCSTSGKAMAAYCDENGLPISRIGKVIVPTKAADDPQIDVLFQRAKANGARAEILDEKQLKEAEPDVVSPTGRALFTPDTSVVDSKAILNRMADELRGQGVEICLGEGTREIRAKESFIRTPTRTFSYGHLFNTAGLYADAVAASFGLGENLTFLPFKGIYYKLSPEAGLDIRHLIYPVPDLRVPFLGVHFTTSTSGTTYLGPTAVPAFGRENYRGIQGMNLLDTPGILMNLAQQYFLNKQGFRTFAHEEGLRFFKSKFAEAARALVPKLRTEHLLACEKVGLRPQLLDLRKRELVMDFLVEKVGNSTHVLNAISPAFTCSLGFSKLVLDEYYR